MHTHQRVHVNLAPSVLNFCSCDLPACIALEPAITATVRDGLDLASRSNRHLHIDSQSRRWPGLQDGELRPMTGKLLARGPCHNGAGKSEVRATGHFVRLVNAIIRAGPKCEI